MKKLLAIITFFAGYILGSKAGKERYEQIKKYSNKIYKTPVVEKTVKNVSTKAETFVKKQGEKVTDKVAEIIKDNLFTTKVRDAQPKTDTPKPNTTTFYTPKLPDNN